MKECRTAPGTNVTSKSGLLCVTQSKLIPLTTQQPTRQVATSWGKESDFIQKASKLRRWQTSALKNHLEV